MSKNRYRNTTPDIAEEIVETQTEVKVEAEQESEVAEPEVVRTCRGVVSGCQKLNVRVKPDRNGAVVCAINNGTEVIVNEQESTDDFYMIYIASGIEGFCMKQFISIQ